MSKRDYFSKRTKEISSSAYKKRMLFSFLVIALLVTAGIFAWKGLNNQPNDQGVLKPLRNTLLVNEKILTSTFDSSKKAKAYSVNDAAKNVRVNGLVGMEKTIDTSTWRL